MFDLKVSNNLQKNPYLFWLRDLQMPFMNMSFVRVSQVKRQVSQQESKVLGRTNSDESLSNKWGKLTNYC